MLALVAALLPPLAAPAGAQEVDQGRPPLPLIPDPARVEPPADLHGDGRTHVFAGPPVLRVADPGDGELVRLARRGARLLEERLGTSVETVLRGPEAGSTASSPAGSAGPDSSARERPASDRTGVMRLEIDPAFPDTSREAYAVEAGADGVRVTARGYPGLFYGLQTVRQLVRPAPSDGWAVPEVRISDRPRFPYRGVHLDVARHYFPPDVVKRVIDLAARYKLNRFHWHLTDDQGWRIEIERFPRLTEVGAYRRETVVEKNFDPYVGDGVPHGGFYTREEIRDVVEYAAERYVTVIPEIEMPGHARAALAAYPELACTPGPFEVATRWGVFEDVFCPSERTFAFLEGVLAEVMELFPGPYIHVGGDEVPKARWRESELAQEVIRREGLADEDELHGWFIGRIGEFLRRHGRRLIGWDEILDGGLPEGATVMSWRGTAGGIEAARRGHDVIMSPTSHLYFDYYQGDPATEPLAIGGRLPLERVYAFEPVPGELTAAEARHVLGPQANLWTEYVKTPAHLEYMLFPRLLALAEVAWSPRGARDRASFEARLPAALETLDRLGVHYRIPEVRGLGGERLALDSVVALTLAHPHPAATIRYTTDGSEPGPDAPRYEGPLTLRLQEPVRVRARPVLPDGREGPVSSGLFRRATPRAAAGIDEGRLRRGLRYAYVEGRIESVRELRDGEFPGGPADPGPPSRPPDRARRVAPPAAERRGGSAIVPDIALRGGERDEGFALRFTGYLRVPADGVYRFTLLSDDGSALWIGDELVVDHDGLHGPSERSGEAALRAGHHPITVLYFQAGGGKTLELFVTPPGGERTTVPWEWLWHLPGRRAFGSGRPCGGFRCLVPGRTARE